MSATVTTGKLAAAVKAANGKIMYVLFEETYEKNCYPHTPRWSCIFIGFLEMGLKRIFLHASSCEGGMLQNRNGSITPEGYIAGWLEKLAAPVKFDDRLVELKLGNSYSTIPTEKSEAVFNTLSGMGRQDIVNTLFTGSSFEVVFSEAAELIAAIYDGVTLPPWRIISGYQAPTNGLCCADLGYAPVPVPTKSVKVVVPAFLKIDGDNRLVQRDDGTWYCGDWEYYIIAKYVRSLWESEMHEPGSYRKRIKAYRNALKAAQALPEGTKVVVDLSVPLEGCYERELVAKLPAEIAVTETATGYEIAVTSNQELLWKLTHLPNACTSWVVPSNGMPPATGQLDLAA